MPNYQITNPYNSNVINIESESEEDARSWLQIFLDSEDDSSQICEFAITEIIGD